MKSAALRIFSGLHAGAEIELSDGSWVIGRDDSCDIVLADAGLAPRHAVLRAEGGAVQIEPLDGRVERASGEAAEGAIPAGELFRLGPVLLAWAPSDEASAAWRAISASLQSASTAYEVKAAEEEVGARLGQPEAVAHATEAEPASNESPTAAAPAEGADSAQQRQGEKRGAAGWAALAAVLLCAAAAAAALASDGVRTRLAEFLAERGAEGAAQAISTFFESESGADSNAAEREALQKTLAARDLEGVEAEFGPDGRCCIVRGWVRDDAERGAVLAAARRLTSPVTLEIKVATDYTAGPLAALEAQGFAADVAFEPSRDGVSPDRIRVAAYMATSEIEDAAFAKLADAWPVDASGRRLAVDRRILHRGDVAKLLAENLPESLRQRLRAEYLPGSVRLSGRWRDDERETIDAALERVRAAASSAGIPLRLALAQADASPVPAPALKAAPPHGEPKKPAASGPDFRVAAVSGGAIPFVTLSTGEKVFAGGTLPGGFALEEIGHDKLVLSKDNQKINFPLRLSK